MKSRTNHLARMLLGGMLVLILSACELRSWVDIDLSSGREGTVVVQFGFDDELREAIEGFGGSNPLEGLEEEVGEEGWTVAPFTDETVSGITVSRQFSDLAELQQLLQTAGAEEGPLMQSVNITETDDSIIFQASVGSPLDDPAGGGLGMGDMDLLTVDGRVTVTFPGRVVSHNGTLEGNTVTWTFDENTSGLIEMTAEARRGGGIDPPVIIGLALVLVVVGVIWYSKAGPGRRAVATPDEVLAPEPAAGDV